MPQSSSKDAKPLTGKLSGPLVWRAEDLTEQDWLYRLDATCMAEIETVTRHLRHHHLPTIILNADDYDMPGCRAVMGRVRAGLDSGCGFALVDRLPVDAMSKDEAKAIYWLLASMVSRPVAQKMDGTMIYDVHDTGAKAVAGSGVRPDKTNIDLTFHNDNSYNNPMPDYVGLLCLKPAKRGGMSRVMSFETAHNAVVERHSDTLARLYEPFIFDRQREHSSDDQPTIAEPIFENDGGLKARLGLHQVRNGYEMIGTPVDGETAKAIAALEDVFADTALQFRFTMESGQFQFVNNRVIGHSRTEFEDFPEPEARRHLVRLWMRDAGDRAYLG